MSDINFDQLAERFQRNIYGTTKGRIRLEILRRDLTEVLASARNFENVKILDAGCGMAQISTHLAEQGHHVVLNDVSKIMLDAAQKSFEQKGMSQQYRLVCGPLQDLRAQHDAFFDLIMNHAVLEWTESPKQALDDLVYMLKPGGYLSLMFYNIHSLVFRNLVRGNLYKVDRSDWAGTGEGSLTPINPLDPDEVFNWLEQHNMKILCKSGVRVFQDYMSRHNREHVSDDDIVATELKYSRQEPYLHLGRYIHVVCQKFS